MIEQTLILLKPDAVQRALVGRIIQRFENIGMKIIGMKMILPDKRIAKKHYGEDITKRRGKRIRDAAIKFITSSPVIAMVLEGSSAVENIRKITGTTEPKSALPGTIRGDFSHHSFNLCDSKSKIITNIIHSSANKKEAKKEISLWFKPKELYNYKTVHEIHVF